MPKVIEKSPAAERGDPVSESATADRWLEVFSLFIHDLESPLASTKYLLNLLESDRFDAARPNHRRLVKSSRIALTRAESILYDIMAVARAGKIGLPVENANLVPTAVIEEAIELVSGSAEENNVTLSFTNNSGDIAVQADPKLLKRVLDNLLYNALRHTPGGGHISVYTEPGQKSLFIHVKDSGSGLGDIDTEALFEKYGQVLQRAQGKHRGVGLGLYFCRLAAEGMGGTVLADDHPKGGAVFTIKLLKAEE